MLRPSLFFRVNYHLAITKPQGREGMEFALHGYGGNTDGFVALLYTGRGPLLYGMNGWLRF